MFWHVVNRCEWKMWGKMEVKLENLKSPLLIIENISWSAVRFHLIKTPTDFKGAPDILPRSLAFRFLHFSTHPAERPCLFVSLSPCFADVTLLWQVSLRFLSLYCIPSISLLVSVCLPLSLVSFQFDITVLSLCRSASPCLSVCLSFLMPTPHLMFFGCDRSRVNLYNSFFFFGLAIGCHFSPADVFPSEWSWKWKSCTSRHSRGWTACTCEHKTSGDAVTFCLFLSPLLFSADIPQILTKKLKVWKVTPAGNFRYC